ncbi:glycosyltransferase family A protein [Novosphingobium sp.]|uniref:glycosyltransferase family 2 protein n=1 Tax=Novosphingobium sp. TaxID=1874826 RepID=UPI0026007EF3|nr:glycosyltransferase family A protein [Novosphingobium sp.]
MTAPLVSVLIPCFNAAPYVGAAIESVLAQTYTPIEVIVVDDGSTDGSAGVVAAFADRGVALVSQAKGSAAAARNAALARAAGEFVMFLDADDLIDEGHVAALMERLEPGSRAVAMGQWDRFTDAKAEAAFPERQGYHNASGIDWLCGEWSTGAPMTQCGTFLIPRTLLHEVGGWDERLTLIDDFEFFARLLTTCAGVRFAPEARLFYRSGHASGLSAQTSRKAAESACLALFLGTSHVLAARSDATTRRLSANMLKNFDYTFYPAFPDLRRKLAARMRELGESDLQPVGPPGFHKLRKWIGWRAAKRVQTLAERIGMNRAARHPVQHIRHDG